MQRQVANAIAAFATIPGVAVDPTADQKRRIERLRALLEHSDFGGVQTRLGALIGLKSGAFIRQMLEGDRPITEKTIAKFEAARNGKYKGWFTDLAEDQFQANAAAALQAISGDEALRIRALAYLQGLADLAQQAHLGGAPTQQDDRSPGGKLAA